jgi:hypothetical protein
MRRVSSSLNSTLSLSPFAPLDGGAVRSLEVQVERAGNGVLHFQYTLDADTSRVRIPERKQAGPADELWKHTCFEAFVAGAGETAGAAPGGYRELNFSPSTEWAVYSFRGYRDGMAPLTMPSPPDIRVETTPSRLRVDARVDARALFAGARLRVALAAVIEDEHGNISYWALKHAPAKPDFHHPSGFILEV